MYSSNRAFLDKAVFKCAAVPAYAVVGILYLVSGLLFDQDIPFRHLSRWPAGLLAVAPLVLAPSILRTILALYQNRRKHMNCAADGSVNLARPALG